MNRSSARVLGAFAALGVWSIGIPAAATPFDPRDFLSLGSYTATSTWYADTDANTMRFDSVVLHGSASNGVSVFSFDSLTVGDLRVTGSRPIALLSRGDVTLYGRVDAAAWTSTPGSGGYGSGAGNLPGPGPGNGGPGGGFTPYFQPPYGPTIYAGQGAGGGGFGGLGGAGGGFSVPSIAGGPGGAGGASYGDLRQTLQGGSAGGGFGGAGGGAVEIGALGSIFMNGVIDVRGGDAPADLPYYGGGGGSGGGILLHADAVHLLGTLEAAGGTARTSLTGLSGSARAIGGSGGGGGGRVLVLAGSGGFDNRGRVDVTGSRGSPVSLNGPYWAEGGGAGAAGTFRVETVPEPGAGLLLGCGLFLLALERARTCGRIGP